MGNKFSVDTLKVQLKMAITRLNLHTSKLTNENKIAQRKVAELLVNEKENSARIKAEGVIHEREHLVAFEVLALHCELLTQRIGLIAASDKCPEDLFVPVASIIYCSEKLPIPELKTITQQFTAKFGTEWVMGLRTNVEFIDPKVRKALEVRAPSAKEITDTLVEIASKYDVDWAPEPVEAEFAPLVEEKFLPATVKPKASAPVYSEADEAEWYPKKESGIDRGADDCKAPDSADPDTDDLAARFAALRKK